MFDLSPYCSCIELFNVFIGASGQNTIYTMAMPKGKESLEGYTYDKSSETELALKVSM